MSVQAMAWALKSPVVTSGQMLLLMVLGNYADDQGYCWPLQETLAANTRMTVRGIRKLTVELQELGLVQVEERFEGGLRRRHAYRLNLDSRPELSSPRPAQNNQRHRNSVPLARNSVPKIPELSSPPPTPPYIDKPSIEPSAAAAATACAQAREPEAKLTAGQDWLQRLAEAATRAANALDQTNPATKHAADLRRLCEPTTGPPCDWERDVLPAIDAVAAQCRRDGKLIRSWTWINATALDFRNRRLTGNPEIAHVPAISPAPPTAYASGTRQRARSFASIGMELAARAAEAERRQREGGNSWDGDEGEFEGVLRADPARIAPG